jgi:hypothetical protein
MSWDTSGCVEKADEMIARVFMIKKAGAVKLAVVSITQIDAATTPGIRLP